MNCICQKLFFLFPAFYPILFCFRIEDEMSSKCKLFLTAQYPIKIEDQLYHATLLMINLICSYAVLHTGEITIQMAPVEYVPYSVYYFLELVKHFEVFGD